MFKIIREPVVVAFPAHKAMGAHGPVDVDAEVRVMVIYRRNQPGEVNALSCSCPRVVKADGLVVWHSPECGELANA